MRTIVSRGFGFYDVYETKLNTERLTREEAEALAAAPPAPPAAAPVSPLDTILIGGGGAEELRAKHVALRCKRSDSQERVDSLRSRLAAAKRGDLNPPPQAMELQGWERLLAHELALIEQLGPMVTRAHDLAVLATEQENARGRAA